MNVHRNLLEMFIAICFYCLQTSDKNVFVNQEDEDGFSGSGSRRKWEQELNNSGSTAHLEEAPLSVSAYSSVPAA